MTETDDGSQSDNDSMVSDINLTRETEEYRQVVNPGPEGSPSAPPDIHFPIIGIGASAGGLSAFEAFFAAIPESTRSGMAFVLVQHLSPNHKSMLTEIIRRCTWMPVYEVEDGMRVEPDSIYIIPPKRDMVLVNGILHLMEQTTPRSLHLPIDYFFRSLAQDLRERSIGIVLSGTGSDCTLGVREIKAAGGMVMVQSPESAEYSGMLSSAIATGLADYVLAPAEMPAQLIAYIANLFGQKFRPLLIWPPGTEGALHKVFHVLRNQTGHDFSQYKHNTIIRRIERRMGINQIDHLDAYLSFLQQSRGEAEALFGDLLIGVTCFFRDPGAFATLQDLVIPQIFANKSDGSAVRVWVPGCSTGEEAYSIAILLQEYMEIHHLRLKVQIFASDLNGRAIELARIGVYPASIAADISPERLTRFFTLEPDGSVYRIHKVIRDMLVFSVHNVIQDPPFSKLDLISFRNVMIYFGENLQKKLVPLFHYALNPDGYLLLGTSETAGDGSEYFATVDRKMKLYQHKADAAGNLPINIDWQLNPLSEDAMRLRLAGKAAAENKFPLRELTERTLLQHHAPASALVNGRGEILYLHGRTGRYLEPAPGEAGLNIRRMAREGLRRELTDAMGQARTGQEIVCRQGLRVKTNGGFSTVNLTVRPVLTGAGSTGASGLMLVIFEETQLAEQPIVTVNPAKTTSGNISDNSDHDTRIQTLKQELRAREEDLASAIKEMEISSEELKVYREEMQSVNEELQSINEEMETSKEELQSVNEELATVNAELEEKVNALTRVNNDMNNLISGTGIGTIFVDHQMRILRFTPAVTQMINLIRSDVGRPVGHIVNNLVGYNSLVEDVQSVLDNLVPKEVEVQTRAGGWYSLRIRPYRTLENVIEGAVVMFVDINEMKHTRDALHQSKVMRRVLFETMPQGIVFQDQEGRIIDANPAAEKILGLTLQKMREHELNDPNRKVVRMDNQVLGQNPPTTLDSAKTGSGDPGVLMGVYSPKQEKLIWLSLDALLQLRQRGTGYNPVLTSLADVVAALSPEPNDEQSK